MAFDVNNPYFRTKVLTATPEQLKLMLIEGCIHFVELGKIALEKKDFESVYENLSQGKAILFELINNLRPELDPDLCGKLASLYTYLIVEITEASLHKAPDRLDNAIKLLEYERETWQMLIEKVAKERGESAPAANAVPEVSDASPEQQQRRSISLSA